MGHATQCTVVYVGLARLPQPLVASVEGLAVELEVEPASGRVVAARSNLPFPLLERLLDEVLAGKPLEACAESALLELEVRYCAPFTSALRVAVQSAVRRAMADADGAEPVTAREAPPAALASRAAVQLA